MTTSHSPKARFRASITFDKPLKGIGSCISYNGEDLELLKSCCEKEVTKIGCGAYIEIKENRKVYPEFDWATVYTAKI